MGDETPAKVLGKAAKVLGKGDIFDMLYKVQTSLRSGGGTQRKKIARVAPSLEDMMAMEKVLEGNILLV